MSGKEPIKVSLSTFFLIIAIIVIIVMGYFMYKFYTEKINEEKQVEFLNNQINDFKNTINNLEEKINKISNVIEPNTDKIENDDKENILEGLNNVSDKKKITIGTKRDTLKVYFSDNNHFNDDGITGFGYYDFMGDREKYGKLDYIVFGYGGDNIIRSIGINDRGTKDGIGTGGETKFESVVDFYKDTENVQVSKEDGLIVIKLEDESNNMIIRHDFTNNILTKITLYV